ncbi:PR-1-like protein [Schizophyllum commune Tattone D]|nr:PR-1-like protein [Schizophyllum commune Tattone D]
MFKLNVALVAVSLALSAAAAPAPQDGDSRASFGQWGNWGNWNMPAWCSSLLAGASGSGAPSVGLPTESFSQFPTANPSDLPPFPTDSFSQFPTSIPSDLPSVGLPTESYSQFPTSIPSDLSQSGALPTESFSQFPTSIPSDLPTASASSAPASAATSAPASSASPVAAAVNDDVQQWLDLHNAERAKHGADPLTWSDEVAKYAQDYSAKCVWEHSGGQYGENLAAGPGLTIEGAVNMWNEESKDYDPANPQYSHWTQVVWKGTTQLGCGVTVCPSVAGMDNASLYVCSYNPPGNYIGEFGENVQP